LDQVVGGYGHRLHDDQGDADANRRLEPLGDREEGAHAEEKDERQVFLEDGALDQLAHADFPPSVVRRRNSGSSTCSAFRGRRARSRRGRMKKALRASSSRPSAWNPPPESTVRRTA